MYKGFMHGELVWFCNCKSAHNAISLGMRLAYQSQILLYFWHGVHFFLAQYIVSIWKHPTLGSYAVCMQ